MTLSFLKLNGREARAHAEDLARLRLLVFHDYPYLYEGDLAYEMNYLETYFKAQHSFIFMVLDHGVPVGATTGIWAAEEEESFSRPFHQHGFNPEHVFYFGESVLVPEYRRRGLGKVFFKEREAFAKKLSFIQQLAFCAVIRPDNHPLKPSDYSPLDSFWISQGFQKKAEMKTSYKWLDRDQVTPTSKEMQYWLKEI